MPDAFTPRSLWEELRGAGRFYLYNSSCVPCGSTELDFTTMPTEVEYMRWGIPVNRHKKDEGT